MAGATPTTESSPMPFAPSGCYVRILFGHEDHLHRWRCVGVNGQRVFGEGDVRNRPWRASTIASSMSAIPMPPGAGAQRRAGIKFQPVLGVVHAERNVNQS
jgi:hypothetical protein